MTTSPPSPLGAFPTLDTWNAQHDDIRATLWRYLGDMPPLFTPSARLISKTAFDGYTLEKIAFENGEDSTVPGYLLIPDNLTAPAPAILYHHVHGGKYHLGKEEIFQGFSSVSQPGVELVRAGFIVFCIDAYGFGERAAGSPHIHVEAGQPTEIGLYKHFVWRGSTLWGMMVRDDILALNYLLSRPEVDAGRVGATGMSLGASRTTWLAALDDRIAALVPVAQMTRYADFASAGNYNLHGIYYYLPGFLKSGIDMEHLAALAAPRPQTILIGDSDPLSPFSGVQTVIEFVRGIYGLYGTPNQFNAVVEPGVAHVYTASMFTAMMETFKKVL